MGPLAGCVRGVYRGVQRGYTESIHRGYIYGVNRDCTQGFARRTLRWTASWGPAAVHTHARVQAQAPVGTWSYIIKQHRLVLAQPIYKYTTTINNTASAHASTVIYPVWTAYTVIKQAPHWQCACPHQRVEPCP